jgi:hypothetical protein
MLQHPILLLFHITVVYYPTNQQRNMRSVIHLENLEFARVVKKSHIVRDIRIFITVFNLRNKTNKSTRTKYVLSHIINFPADVNYPDDDCKNDLIMLVSNNT